MCLTHPLALNKLQVVPHVKRTRSHSLGSGRGAVLLISVGEMFLLQPDKTEDDNIQELTVMNMGIATCVKLAEVFMASTLLKCSDETVTLRSTVDSCIVTMRATCCHGIRRIYTCTLLMYSTVE